MNRRDFPSEAAYLRAHREAFTLALELKCTPKDAELEIKRRETREHWQQGHERLERLMNAPIGRELRAGHDPEEPREPWWQRD